MASGNGYDLLGCEVQSKEDQTLSSEYLKGYLCVKCQLLLRDAVQMSCGDRMCQPCVPSTLFSCPSCKETVDPTVKQSVFSDRRCQKDIRELVVVCKCGEKLKLIPWEEHCDICPVISKDRPKQSSKEQIDITRNLKKLESEARATKSEMSEVKKISQKSIKRVESLEKEVKIVKAIMEDLRGMGMSGQGGKKEASSGSRMSSTDVQRINTKLEQLNEIITQLVADVEQHKGTIAQMNTTMDGTTRNMTRYENILEELNLKIEILEVKSCTGVYVWKVNDLSRRSREARVGRTVSLYSPPFYTSTHGYRICLRAYLNGDGDGRNTHVSLFVVIMKSEYDDLLGWPFSHRVTLSLVNQAQPLVPNKSITHKFNPNPESSSFQKPLDTFNVASGFPKFAEIKMLDEPDFNRNDTIYFRVRLDKPSASTGPDNVEYS